MSDIKKQVEDINIRNITTIANKVKAVVDSEFRVTSQQNVGDFVVNTINNTSFKGQFITKNDVVVHCSLLRC